MPGPEKVYFVGGNPIHITAAETWVCLNHGITVDSMVWHGITADGSTIIVAKDASSAEASNLYSRTGKQDIPMSLIPGEEKSFSALYVREMSSGFLEINLK